jgi:hypothetical protein
MQCILRKEVESKMFDTIKADEGIQKAIVMFTKVTIWGAVIIGTMLFIKELLGFTFDLKIGLGL